MNSLRPKYGWYLLWWTGLWVLLTVTTQMPECYQRSVALDAGTPSAIYRDLADFAATRAMYEAPLGLFWGLLSWWLFLRRYDVQKHFTLPILLQRENSITSPFRRLITSATFSVALAQGAIFGLPLAYLYILLANFGMGNDDAPPVTINNQSIAIEAVGIVLAFSLSTLVAGMMAARTPRGAMP